MMASTRSGPIGLPEAYPHFWHWVGRNMVQGVDGNGNECQYVPYHKLQEYWDLDRIAKFPGIDETAYSIEDIRDHRLIVLSILVFISTSSKPRVGYLHNFFQTDIDDHSLPLRLPPTICGTNPSMQYADRVPRPFPHQDDGAAVWKAFDKWQWQFCPIVFRRDGRIIEKIHSPLDVRHIRPVTILKELPGRPNGTTRLLKAEPHQSSGLQDTPIVIKEYKKPEFEYEFSKEVTAYTTIRNRATIFPATETHFLRYHGSFLQGDKCVILVEFADEGSLLEFFKDNKIPSDLEESYQLWKDLSSLFVGLVILHNGERNVGVHQDLKPANIFVFKNPEKEYGFQFKLGDFGMCSVTEVDPARETIASDNHGTKMYSALELCCTERDLRGIDRGVTWEADIWSVGCIMLETGIWMHQADRGRHKFLQARQAATAAHTKFCDAGYEGAFHDGCRVLDIVRNAPNLFADGNARERLSSSIMAFIVKGMLLGEEGKRLNAEQLKTQFNQILECNYMLDHQSNHRPPAESTTPPSSTSISSVSIAAEDKRRGKQPERLRLTTQVPPVTDPSRQYHHVDPIDGQGPCDTPSHLHTRLHTDDERSPKIFRPPSLPPSNKRGEPSSADSDKYSSAHQRDGTTPQQRPPNAKRRGSNYPHVTIPEVHTWMQQHKIDRYLELVGMNEVLKYVANRDQVFIIDNSPSMAEFWPQVMSTCHALCYVVKGVDPDGFDVAFTSNPSSMETMQCCSKLLGRFGPLQLNRPKQAIGVCRMEHVLTTLLPIIINKALRGKSLMNRVRKRKPSGINLYVLTNGVWEGEPTPDANGHTAAEANGVENAIQHAVELLQKEPKSRIFLSIQFIQFGNHAIGERRLKWLDNNIKERTHGWDIVDRTYHEGTSIWKMITGAMSEVEDEAHDVVGECSRRMEA